MGVISNTPRPGYAWDSTDNVWYPIGTGTHSHNEIAKTIVDAKGDIIAGTANDTVDRLAVGTDGQSLVADSTTATGLKWATPSGVTTWTNRLVGDSYRFNQIAYNGSNLYVAVGDNGKLYSSSNGTTWTSRTSGFGANIIQDVTYGAGIWVAVGDNGTITTSTDGTTWTARTSNMSTNTLYQVVFANSLFVVVGDGGGATNTGGIAYSSDGITWTRKSQTPTVGTTYYTVAWNGTNWVVGANTSTNNYLYASTPSSTWTAGATGPGNTIYTIYWDGTRHIINENGTLYWSTSTTIGTTTGQNYSNFFAVSSSLSKATLKLYSSTLYRISTFYQSAIPTSQNTIALGTPINAPTMQIAAAGTTGGSIAGALFVGAIGTIIADTRGNIYTSF